MKNGRNNRKKYRTLILVLAMAALFLGGCKRSGSDTADAEKKEFVYVPEYRQIDFGMNSENINVNSVAASGDFLYLVVNSWGEEKSDTGLYKYDLIADKVEKFPLVLGENDYIMRMAASLDGNLVTMISHAEYELDENGDIIDYSATTELRCVSGEDGSIVNSEDVTQLLGEDSYIQQFVIDGEGNYYFYDGDKNVHVFGQDLHKICEIGVDNWIYSIVTSKEGDVYISVYGNEGLEIRKIDLGARSTGEALENIITGWGNQNYFTGTSKSLLCSGETVSLYDIATAAKEDLFSWIDVDVNNNYVESVGELSDGRIWAVHHDYEVEGSKPELLILNKVKASEATQKEEITYGTVGLDWEVKKTIINFNKSNEKYRIVVKDYGMEDYAAGLTQFNADMTTANCPDIINLSHANYSMYVSKGILENLYPYMEKSGLKKEDYVENVFTAYEVDGKLYAVITKFDVSTIMAKKSVVGDIEGWTLSEMLDFAQEYDPENLFSYGSRYSIFYNCIYNNIDEFIDWETGKCSFDGEEFIRTLEFAARYPEEVNYNADREGTYALLKANKILLLDSGISSVQQFQMFQGMFEEEIVFVGYPNHERKGNLISPQGGCMGISSKSKHKDGAWEFVRSMIDKEYQENMRDNWGFPVLKSALEKRFQDDMTAEYYENENGEQIENTKTSWGYDDFSIDIYAATQEEIDTVKSLLESADKIVGSVDEQLTQIITEEAEPFFKGQKSAADVANIIQNRIQIYVNENR